MRIVLKYPFFKIAFGWFPSDAKEVADKEIQYLIDQTPYLDCLGEIGLDYYWDTSFNDLQKELFIKQIQIANEQGKKVRYFAIKKPHNIVETDKGSVELEEDIKDMRHLI